MKYGEEIKGAIKNIDYYANKIKDAVRGQFSEDSKKDLYIMAAGVRFDCLGCIDSAAEWIQIYCKNIESNLKSAESQDANLHNTKLEEQEQEIEQQEEVVSEPEPE